MILGVALVFISAQMFILHAMRNIDVQYFNIEPKGQSWSEKYNAVLEINAELNKRNQELKQEAHYSIDIIQQLQDELAAATRGLPGELIGQIERWAQDNEHAAVRRVEPGVAIEYPLELLYYSDESRVYPSARPVLDEIAWLISQHSADEVQVSIFIHDNILAVDPAQSESHAQLAISRVEALMQYLEDRGVEVSDVVAITLAPGRSTRTVEFRFTSTDIEP